MTYHDHYMQRCIDLAKNAKGQTSPNPLVGAVVVYNDKIIGEGWHHKAGEPHAEVNAINSVQDKSLLSESSIYVSLEPCAHFGKTPPCADLIIKHKLNEVIIGCRDPFESVNGKGIEKLEQAGIKVILGVLEKKCQELNAPFFTFHQKKRPYIILKWAETKDGFMDPIRINNDKGVKWITQPETKVLVHKWRAEVDAILVGKNTVINDNPSLTVREVIGKNPIRIVLAPKGDIPLDSAVLSEEAKTWVVTDKAAKKQFENQHSINFSNNPIKQLMDFCYQQNIQSLLVEGGAHTLQSFIDADLWDEKRVLIGDSNFTEGLKAPASEGKLISETRLGRDLYKRITQ